METDYSKDTHFRWKIKWRLEYLGALGSMGEMAPLVSHTGHSLFTVTQRSSSVPDSNLITSSAKDYEIPRSKISLDTIIGQGQFGDVHRGTYNSLVSWKTNFSVFCK